MKSFVYALLGLFLFPAASFAGIEGKYELDYADLLTQLLPKILKHRPKEQHAAIIKTVKERMSLQRTWMILTAKGQFEGYASRAGQKEKLGATGTWKLKGQILTVDTLNVQSKRKSTMTCTLSKNSFRCKDPHDLSVAALFIKSK